MACLSSKALKQIAKELQKLQQDPPEDVQVIANDENLTEIQAWIRGPDGTPYEGGYFKVKLVMDESFPDTPPKGYFNTKIFHPNVSSIGEICVNTLKKDWKPELGIEHVLLTIKCLLIVPNPESALNEEAGRLLLEQYEDYAKRARLYTSIQAKSGKNDFIALLKERLHNQENDPTTTATTLPMKSATTPITTTTLNTATTESSTVLMPLSNASPVVSPTMAGKKRLHEEQQENVDQKKQRMKKNDKKKTLRRL